MGGCSCQGLRLEVNSFVTLLGNCTPKLTAIEIEAAVKHSSALIVVDMQNDFIPGVSISALPVDGGDSLVKPINKLMECFNVVVATQDWHPPNHCSFKENGGEWPVHCVAGSWGAQLEPFLDLRRVSAIFRKGTDVAVDSYSAFRDNGPSSVVAPKHLRKSTGLSAYLRDHNVERVFICGLARDYCVAATVRDSVEAGFRTFLLNGYTKSVFPVHDGELVANLRNLGVGIIEGQLAG